MTQQTYKFKKKKKKLQTICQFQFTSIHFGAFI